MYNFKKRRFDRRHPTASWSGQLTPLFSGFQPRTVTIYAMMFQAAHTITEKDIRQAPDRAFIHAFIDICVSIAASATKEPPSIADFREAAMMPQRRFTFRARAGLH